jgi:hypothetical protein
MMSKTEIENKIEKLEDLITALRAKEKTDAFDNLSAAEKSELRIKISESLRQKSNLQSQLDTI